METAKHIIVIMAIVLLTTGTAVSDESQISNTRYASCLIKIISDPAILPLDDTTIVYLLHSSGVFGKAARDIFGQLSPEETLDLEQALQIEWLADEADMMQPGPLEDSPQDEDEMSEYDFQMMMQEMGGRGMDLAPGRSRPRRSPGRQIVRQPLSITTEQMILLRIVVNLDIGADVKPVAVEFMNAVIENLDSALKHAGNEYLTRLGSRLQLAEEEVSRTENELNQMQARLRDNAGSRILDKDNILGNITDLRRELQNTKMEQASDTVMVDAITNRIAETQRRLKEQALKDDITNEMQQIIEHQRQQLEAAKKLVEQGVASRETLSEAEQKLARARIELAQRREQMNRTAGGGLIESLNRELADRSIRATQNKAKIAALTRQLEEAEHWLNKSDDHELLSLKADIAKQNLREAIIWRDRISRQMRLIQPPDVTVLGGK
ncbi:MAG: hypothetical protein JW715_09685 [Sedimentisphaerales bacterium]|nr:hypothetical protein [Sedimentisphaerales bacterium]